MSDGASATTPVATPPATPATMPAVTTPAATGTTGTAAPKAEPTVVRKAAGTPSDDDPANRQMVPRSRLREETAKVTAAARELEELKPKAERATALESQVGTLQSQLAFARVGVLDEEHVEAVGAAYAKLGEEGRPASAVEYWQKIAAGEIEAPRGLRGFLPVAGTTGATAAPARPKLPTATAEPPGAGPAVTEAQLAAAQAAVRADPSEANRKKLVDATAAYSASLNARARG